MSASEAQRGRAERTAAEPRRSRWPGWIWAVPIAAAAIVGWLVLRHIVESGPEVTVSFPSAGGIKAGDTKVKYKELEVGHVTEVKLASDLGHVEARLRLDSDIESALREGTRFWIVGGQPSATDLGSLMAAITGPYIALDPGPGQPAHHFVGLEHAPPVANGTAGTSFVLETGKLGSLQAGAAVTYLGLEVGSVIERKLVAADRFEIRIFVRSPYDRLVHSGTRFWNAGGVAISTEHGVSADLPSLPALLSGAVAFETTGDAERSAAAADGQRFTLYDSHSAAEEAPTGPGIPYRVSFAGAVGNLKIGAAVRLRGFEVGTVRQIDFRYDAAADRLETPVTIAIEPVRLLGAGTQPAGGDARAAADRALDALVRHGLRARLDRATPVIGEQEVTLDFVEGAAEQGLIRDGDPPEIPSAGSGDIAGLTAQAHDILGKIDALPLAAIGASARSAVEHVDSLVSSPDLKSTLQHLDAAVADIEATARMVRGKAGPVIDNVGRAAAAAQDAVRQAGSVLGGRQGAQDADVPDALRELTNAARSIRDLASYLDRHPEALLAGKPGSTK